MAKPRVKTAASSTPTPGAAPAAPSRQAPFTVPPNVRSRVSPPPLPQLSTAEKAALGKVFQTIRRQAARQGVPSGGRPLPPGDPLQGGGIAGGVPIVAQPVDRTRQWESLPQTGIQTLIPCSTRLKWANPNFASNEWGSNWGIEDLAGVAGGNFLPQMTAHPQTASDISRAILAAESAGQTIRAFGSLWGFSDASFPQVAPDSAGPAKAYGFGVNTSGINGSLQPFLPSILADGLFLGTYFFVEAGITLSDLNQLLDQQPRPQALPTLGGSDGQTLAGAIATGTHGCDFDRPPLADAVQAIYLIGAGGTHYWIERTAHITDPTKLQNIFPCLAPENINYDDTMFRAALVSMGSMGVVFAILLSVEDEYTLAQASRYGTWEQLLGPQPMGAGSDLSGAITGDWTGLIHWANGKYPAQEYPRGGSLFAPRALQVLINPIANDDGSHACIATARIEVPWQMSPSGPTSADFSQLGVLDLMSVIFHDPDCGVGADLELGPTVAWLAVEARPAGMEGELYQIGQLIGCCENNGYAWAVRALINFVLQSSYPEYDPHFLDKYPRVDIGHNIMAGGVFPGGFPQGGILSTESFFDLPTGLAFIGQLLSMLDSEVSDGHYPAGYVSLRLCGPSIATLGMQKDSPTACVEVAFLNTGNALEIIEKVEDLALSNSGRLHWGQMNGHLDATGVLNGYGPKAVEVWKVVQSMLGGTTFNNQFMERCGLTSGPVNPMTRVTRSVSKAKPLGP